MDNNKNQILLIYDLAGYGKVALSVMIPIFSHLKCETFNLPTALVSNTFDYGKFDILDTTGYMRNTINVWNELGFSFNAICTGFIASEEQSHLVYDYCHSQKERNGAKIFTDPVMADNGVLYNGVSFETVLYMRKLCAIADVILPNITEAAFLTGCKIPESDPQSRRLDVERTPQGGMLFSKSDIDFMIGRLVEMGSKNIVITSGNIEGKACTIVREEGSDNWRPLYYQEIPAQFSGTGDTFTSLVTAGIMRGYKLEEAVTKAMAVMELLISKNFHNEDKYKGIPIEQYLDYIQI